MSGKLYLVATPIGNLDDMTHRAVEVLRNADVICAEDTRHSRKLLSNYGITKRPVSYHEHNAQQMTPRIAGWVSEGKLVALISDAGTPGISDPGFRAIKLIIDEGLQLESIPGPTAIVNALILSGLGVDRFTFEGFLPVKKGRKKRLQEISTEKRTTIIFEAPHKLLRTLRDLKDSLQPDRLAAIARELTKIHEEVIRERIDRLVNMYDGKSIRGEIVLVIEGLEAYNKRMRKQNVS